LWYQQNQWSWSNWGGFSTERLHRGVKEKSIQDGKKKFEGRRKDKSLSVREEGGESEGERGDPQMEVFWETNSKGPELLRGRDNIAGGFRRRKTK